jgi:penicillin amidase
LAAPRFLRRRISRIALRALLGVIAALVLFAAGSYGWLSYGRPVTQGRVILSGLEQDVGIYRDTDGVPHIFAANEADAYRALGFVHAQDRLFQMEIFRRTGAGRLSEILGSAALPVDRFMRVMGFYRIANASFAHLGPATRAALTAYAEGVNGYIASHRGSFGPEFFLLGIRPEAWTPADSLVFARIMSVLLGGDYRAASARAALARRLAPEELRALFPDDPGARNLAALPPEKAEAALARAVAAVPELLHPRLASNAWVVDGAHSATGRPLLANDPHLMFNAPSLWYLARITTPDFSLTGATAPGVPFHLLGQNRSFAWGLTTTGAATQDLFIERLAAGDPTRYDTPAGPQLFTTRQEVIHVRFGEDVVMRVRETRHGVVISDLPNGPQPPENGPYVMVLATTARSEEDHTAEALYKLGHATDVKSGVAALADWVAPVQNVMLADQSGHIGLVVAGRIPVRAGGATNFVPAQGWTGTGDWTGFVPFDKMPRRLDPPDGRLINANNRVVGPDYPFFIARDWDDSYRADRIAALLGERTKAGAGDMGAIQLDTVAGAKDALLPQLLAAGTEGVASPLAPQAARLLAAWDGRMLADRAEPLIYAAWVRAVGLRVLGEARLGRGVRFGFATLARLLAKDSPLCRNPADPRQHTCVDAMRLGLQDALAVLAAAHGTDMTRWRWGDEHVMRNAHQVFDQMPLLRNVFDILIPADGGDDTVNRAAYPAGGNGSGFPDLHGASYRAVYDLADPARSQFIIATGQSGSILSPHWRDMLQRWRNGGYRTIAGTPAELRQAGASLLELVPP